MHASHSTLSLSLSLALAAALGSSPSQAETITVPVGQQAGPLERVPQRGDAATAVETTFGAPQARIAAVGSPPISRWDYPGFAVYFEGGQVLHTVAKREPSVTSSAPD